MARTSSDELLGVRDGFHRYLREVLNRTMSVVVVPHSKAATRRGLTLTDATTLDAARRSARALHEEVGDAYHFHVGTEGGLHSLELDDGVHYFVRNWTVILGVMGEAMGASGSVEVPDRFISGPAGREVPVAIPGKRRRGGMISSLTAGLETRRIAVATATFHALSTLFYGVLEGHPGRPL